MSRKKSILRLGASILALSMSIPVFPKIPGMAKTVKAAWEKDADNTRVGISSISNPKAPNDVSQPWMGSYVYFGSYDEQPIKFRVLDTKAGEDGDRLFLDSDKTLYDDAFDEDNVPNTGVQHQNMWRRSDVKNHLNGEMFLNKAGVFTDAEKFAIAESSAAGHELTGISEHAIGWFESYVPLEGEKVFLLDVEDALNPGYGYYDVINFGGSWDDWAYAKSRVKTYQSGQPSG